MKVAIILGHPNKKSFNAALADEYEKTAKKLGHDVKRLNVIDMKFDALTQPKTIEKDVKEAQDIVTWADHLVFVFPNWWSTMPALMKGFFDRVFVTGVTFKFISQFKWEKLLTSKSARVIATMGTPCFVYKCFMGNPIKKNMKGILNFCGVKPVKYTYVDQIMRMDKTKAKEWLAKVSKLAKKDLR